MGTGPSRHIYKDIKQMLITSLAVPVGSSKNADRQHHILEIAASEFRSRVESLLDVWYSLW